MTTMRLVIVCGIFSLLAGCAEELPPRSVAEFLENRILLEATMVRCGENRNQSKYDAECVNAREAINRIAAQDEKARRAELEAQSERKRKSLRRTQEAAAEARRRAAEARRMREEAEYLGNYGDPLRGTAVEGATPTGSDAGSDSAQQSYEPGNVEQVPEDDSQSEDDSRPEDEAGQDLEAIREELRRRQHSN